MKAQAREDPWAEVYETNVVGCEKPNIPIRAFSRQLRLYGFHESKEAATSMTALSPINAELLNKIHNLQQGDLDYADQLANISAIDLSSPSVTYLMAKLSKTNPKLSLDFLDVRPEDQFGRPDLPVHHHVFNYKTFVRVTECEELTPVKPGAYWLQSCPSAMEFVARMNFVLPKMRNNDSFWFRNRYLLGNEIMVHLCKIVKINDELGEAFIQDRTDEYREKNQLLLEPY